MYMKKFLCGMALALVAVSCSNSDDPEIDNPELGNGVGEYCFRITYKGKSSDSFVKPTLGLSLQSINTDKVRNIYYTDNKDKERVRLDIDPNLSYLEFDVGEKDTTICIYTDKNAEFMYVYGIFASSDKTTSYSYNAELLLNGKVIDEESEKNIVPEITENFDLGDSPELNDK